MAFPRQEPGDRAAVVLLILCLGNAMFIACDEDATASQPATPAATSAVHVGS